MDELTEKKWFVYLIDHHEGPHSLEELREKLAQKVISEQTFSWKEGMQDWKVLGDIPEAQVLFQPKHNEAPPLSLLHEFAQEAYRAEPPSEPQSDFTFQTISSNEPSPELGHEFESESGNEPGHEFTPDPSPPVSHEFIQVDSYESAPEPLHESPVELQFSEEIDKKEPLLEATVSSSNERAEPELTDLAQSNPSLFSQDEVTGELNVQELEQTKILGMEAHQEPELSSQQSVSQSPVKKSRSFFWPAFILITLCLGSFLTQPQTFDYLRQLTESGSFSKQKTQFFKKVQSYRFTLSQKFPFLDSWISPLPALSGVSPEEKEELKRTIMLPLSSSGAQFSIALSKEDTVSPSFYISSNLPHDAALELSVVGIPATLLNSLSFQKNEKLILKDHLAHTSLLQTADSNAIPRGEYRVYLLASETQPDLVKPYLDAFQSSLVKLPVELLEGKKILAYKTYFLMGEKDSTYLSRLKEFHDKLKIKSDQEITEAKQYLVTLGSQFHSTQVKYQLLQKGKPSEKQKKSWAQFNDQWSQLQNQLEQLFSKWTAEILEKEYFHAPLYQLIKETDEKVRLLHQIHHQFFIGNYEPTTYKKQLEDQLTQTQDSLSRLQLKIQEAERLPLTSEGLPQKSF